MKLKQSHLGSSARHVITFILTLFVVFTGVLIGTSTTTNVEAESYFQHEAFTILSPVESGSYLVNKEVSFQVRRDKWIAAYVNGFLVNDYNHVYIDICKNSVVEKRMDVNIFYSSYAPGSTAKLGFLPSELGTYTVRVGFATANIDRTLLLQEEKITDETYVGEFTFNVVDRCEHVYGDWTVTKVATSTEKGSREKVCVNCGNCGDKIIEEIPKTASAATTTKATSNINKATVTAKDIKKASDLGATTITLGPKVKKIKKNAFKGTRITKVVVKSKKLKKASVKGSLKGSKVKTIKVNVGNKKANKKYVKVYKKFFTKKNAGKKVSVK